MTAMTVYFGFSPLNVLLLVVTMAHATYFSFKTKLSIFYFFPTAFLIGEFIAGLGIWTSIVCLWWFNGTLEKTATSAFFFLLLGTLYFSTCVFCYALKIFDPPQRNYPPNNRFKF